MGLVIQSDQKIIVTGSGYKHGVPTMVLIKILPDGNIDSSFGMNGIVDTTFGIGESFPRIALQPDGKILLSGWYYPGFITVRYMPDGSIDESFGDKGKVITIFGSNCIPQAITVDAEGNIIVGGDYSGSYSKFLLIRYTKDGTIDKTFGNQGVATTDFGKYGDYLESMRIQPDGKIVVAGVTGTDFIFENENIAIARYETNGSLDQTFGEQGKATIVFEGINSQANSLLLTADNKIVIGDGIGGSAEGTSTDFVLIRLLNSGTLDSSFGINGETITDFGLYETGAHIESQKDKIVLAGTSYTSDPQNQINYALARYNNNGKSQKQIIVSKIRRWLQHHNGIMWDNANDVKTYAVQRSGDGVNWSTVHSQQPTANSQQLMANSYYYNDLSPLNGTNHYRLQTTSVNGAVAYSNVIAVTNSDIKISPNPATNSLRIQGLPLNKTKLTVVDFTGNIKMQITASNSSYNLKITQLKQGNYLPKIETNDEVVTKKFVKE